MAADTKQARDTLHGVINKIGHPERWRDSSTVTIVPDDDYRDATSARAFEHTRHPATIGKVLQPPVFDPERDDAPNQGHTGGTIGHELTHGFDDEGRQFDAKGNLRDWWTGADTAEFERRSNCIGDQHSSYVAVDDVHVNGKLTLGEHVADLGGLILAYPAWVTETAGKKLVSTDGLTPGQRLFVGYAQGWCSNTGPETLRMRAVTDPRALPPPSMTVPVGSEEPVW
jgi:endothelin-converting enzyme/putative endopeptidase